MMLYFFGFLVAVIVLMIVVHGWTVSTCTRTFQQEWNKFYTTRPVSEETEHSQEDSALYQSLQDQINASNSNFQLSSTHFNDVISLQTGKLADLQTTSQVLMNLSLKSSAVFATSADANSVSIKNQYNVASISLDGPGIYTITFATPLEQQPVIATAFERVNDMDYINLMNISKNGFTMEYRSNGTTINNTTYLCFTCHTVDEVINDANSGAV